MATAVQVIFGANSTQFQAELARMQTMAGAAGRRIGGSMAGGHGGHAGQTGIVRESTVIGREIAMGRGMGRILASMTLLSQYMNTAKRNAGQGVSAAAMLADGYEKMAVKARLAAIAALKKAEATASAAALEKDASGQFINTLAAEKNAQNQVAQAALQSAQTVAAAARQKADAAKKAFDDSYKKAQAPGGLTIGSMGQMQSDRAEMKSAAATAEAEAVKAEAAMASAAATQEKTAAELESAIAAESNATETTLAATAAAAEAEAANADAVALEKKAAAAWQSAEADEAAAAAAVTAGGAFKALLGTLGFFALLLVIIAELYVVVTSLVTIFNRQADAEKNAEEYAHAHTLAIWEEIEALEKLKDASEKHAEAMKKMNLAKDRSVELAREAIETYKAEAEMRAKLYDAGIKGKLLDIEIAQKKGLITEKEATVQKAAIESQSVTDKSAAKQKSLDDEARIADTAAYNAAKEKEAAQAAADAADAKINDSPEGKKRKKMLAAAETDLAASKNDAEEARKKEIEEKSHHTTLTAPLAYMQGYGKTTGLEGALQANIPFVGLPLAVSGAGENKNAALKEAADSAEQKAASAEIRVNSLKRFMSPDKHAAENAQRIAEEKTGSALSLKEDARKTATAAAIYRKNSPAEIAAEQADIQKKKQLDLLPGAAEAKGYGNLNSQQRVGSYAATAPVLLQQLNALRVIQHNTTPTHPPSNHPPGPRQPQLGPQPRRHMNSKGTAEIFS